MEPDAFPEAAEGERPRRCPACGTPYPEQDDELGCPVCLFRRAFDPVSEEEPGAAGGGGPSRPDDGRFDHYELAQREDGAFDELGRGAMGVTYRAIDTVLGHAVALKVIDARIAGRPDARERFLREARAAARLRHPHVASVFYYGVRKSDGQCFCAMELVEGETLEARMRRVGKLSIPEALKIVEQVTRALLAAEVQGVVHRDLKPANLMLTRGSESMVKVIDFGLAKAAVSADQSNLTQDGFVGTPAFASPEQFTGPGVDTRSDLYSLGITLWQMLTGRPPFRGSASEVMHQHQKAPLPLEQLQGIPQPIVALIKKLLEKDPSRRFQSAGELLDALPEIAEKPMFGNGELSRPRRPSERSRKVGVSVSPRPRLLLGFAIVLVLVSAAALLIANFFFGPKPDPSITSPPERSIAILPFESLSENKNDAYFADGVQEEILNNLAKIAQLKVISRTSVMQYRGDKKHDMRQIAAALGVANLLEGTVRRDGNNVRVSTELVASNDNTIWADSYDRNLTDIFIIQSEVAQIIATKLTATLSPEEKKRIEARPTDNLEAYDRYLRAKELLLSAQSVVIVGNAWKPVREAITLLDEAIQLDPMFTLAYCASARAHDLLYLNYDLTPQRRALGDAAVNEALRLQPDRPEVHLAYASHLYYSYRDYERAQAQLAIARHGLPNNSEVMFLAAVIDRRQGNWEKAIQELKEALTFDPRNTSEISELALSLFFTRRFREAEQAFKRAIDLAPEQQQPLLKVEKAFFAEFLRTADESAFRSVIEALPKQLADSDKIISWRLYLALIRRDYQQAGQLIEKMKRGEDDAGFAFGKAPVPVGCYSILVARLRGEPSAPNADFAETRELLSQKVRRLPANAKLLSQLAVVDALLGDRKAAISEAKRAVEMMPISGDAVDGPNVLANLAIVYSWTNEFDLAFQTLGVLTKLPNGIYYGDLKLDPSLEPIRQDQRYRKLLAELAPRD